MVSTDSPAADPPSHRRLRGALFSGVVAALLLIATTTYRLDRPGLFYDELHQATGAFSYIGRPTTMFSFVQIHGVPLMNMSYTGAIKTAIYGAYLRASGRPFTIVSWRLLGILFSAAGLIVFCLLAGDRLPVPALALFYVVLLSDTNFLLQSRHDWGPVALGFLLRMIFIGLAIRQLTGTTNRWGPFLLGLVVGFAIFEKLSAAVLLGPLAIILLADSRTRLVRAAAYACIGLAVGALPVIAVNLYSLATTSTLTALTAVDTTPRRSILGYAVNYLILGSGGLERRMIFDTSMPRWPEWIDGVATLALILLVAALAWSRGREDRFARLAGVAVLCYGAVGVALPLLPHGTAEHHWIMGTPFQYVAFALAAASLWSPASRFRAGRAVFVACLAALLLARATAVASAFDAVRTDMYSRGWDPSLNTAASFAARQPASTIFVAASWGIGTQVFCLANGRQDFVFEPFWKYGGPETLNPILAPSSRRLVVAAAIRPSAPLKPGEINTQRQVTTQIFHDLETAPGWEEVPVDPSVRDLRAVEIRMFRRTAS